MAKNTAPVGWHGIILDAPEDWSLTGIRGDKKKGFFQVDSPISSAILVKWEPAGGKRPDLVAKCRELLSAMEKSLRKKSKLSKDIRPDKSDPNSVSFLWRADQLGQGRMIYCEKCDRLTVVQVVSTREENVSVIGNDILASVRDHRDDGWTDWALYGLSFAVPPDYKLEKQTLMSGYLLLSFKNRAKTIVIERWGLASTLLTKDNLEEWYRKDAVPDVKGYRVGFESEEVAGHEGLKIDGVRAGIKSAAKALAYSLTLHPHPKYLSGYVWHCAESNRLFSIRVTHTEGEETAEKIRDLIACH